VDIENVKCYDGLVTLFGDKLWANSGTSRTLREIRYIDIKHLKLSEDVIHIHYCRSIRENCFIVVFPTIKGAEETWLAIKMAINYMMAFDNKKPTMSIEGIFPSKKTVLDNWAIMNNKTIQKKKDIPMTLESTSINDLKSFVDCINGIDKKITITIGDK